VLPLLVAVAIALGAFLIIYRERMARRFRRRNPGSAFNSSRFYLYSGVALVVAGIVAGVVSGFLDYT
jgi:multisubunit Na+/H+ antiporter MnhB subunit